MVEPPPLDRGFFERDSLAVARELIGKLLLYDAPEGRLSGRIVETEAYGMNDPACHAWGIHPGVEAHTKRRGFALFGVPGTAYVYLNYGMYWLLNVVTEPEGVCGAVLIRAIEPVEGIEIMRQKRPGVRRDRDLTNGPGKLTLALGISGDMSGSDLTRSPLYFAEGPTTAEEIATSGRIGISAGGELPWRFYVVENPWVSPGKPSVVARPGSTTNR